MSQLEQKLRVPFTTRQNRICSYAQAVAEMKFIIKNSQNKAAETVEIDAFWADIKLKEKIKSLGNVFTAPEEGTNIEDVLDGFQQRKIKKMQHKFEEKVCKRFLPRVDLVVGELRDALYFKNVLTHSIHQKDVENLEANFTKDAEPEYFSRPMLSDLYFFLRSQGASGFQHEKRFLERQFLKYIKRFYKENPERVFSKAGSIEEKITEFVKLRYNKSDYNIEVFEGRYLYAEVYVLLRCGIADRVRSMLRETSFFPAQFVEKVTAYTENTARVYQSPFVRPSEDKFKQLIFRLLFSPESVQPGQIVSTLEDYLWIKNLAVERGHHVKFEEVLKESNSAAGKLLTCILHKKYTDSLEILLKGEFSATDAFCLGAELYKKEGGRSILFVNFLFLVAKRFSSAENRSKLVSLLCFQTPVAIGRKIIEYEMYEIVEFLPEKYGRELVSILRSSNNKRILLKLYFMNEDEQEIVYLLEESFSEEISSERAIKDFKEFEHSEVYFYMCEKYGPEKYPKLRVLKDFLNFKIKRDLVSLQQMALFDEAETKTLQGLSCIDTIVVIVSGVISDAKSSFLAQKLMNVTGKLTLSEHSQRAMLKALIGVL